MASTKLGAGERALERAGDGDRDRAPMDDAVAAEEKAGIDKVAFCILLPPLPPLSPLPRLCLRLLFFLLVTLLLPVAAAVDFVACLLLAVLHMLLVGWGEANALSNAFPKSNATESVETIRPFISTARASASGW